VTITPVQVFVYPTKKASTFGGLSFEPKQLNKLKKQITTGTKVGVLLLMIRKSKT
jgi:hypothetical protein